MRDVPRPIIGRPIRMLRVSRGCSDPRHLRQLSALYIFSEVVEQVFGPGEPLRFGRSAWGDDTEHVRTGGGVVEEGRAWRCRRVLIEVQHCGVGEVAGERIVETLSVAEKRRG